jgi:hypothetical protein
MSLRRWDVVFLRADERDATGHPAVILSPDDLLGDDRRGRFNVLLGTKKQPAQEARSHQVLLDEADGLGFLTLIDCSLVYVAKKSSVLRPAGSVTVHRRQQIQRTVRACLGLG